MVIYFWIIVLLVIIQYELHGCLDDFIGSRKFLISSSLFVIFVIVKRYIEEIERKTISSNMNNQASAEK
jgi:hypothetical protein